MAELEPRARSLVVRSSSGRFSVHDSDILLVRYRQRPEIWDLPGGHIAPNEKPEITAVREAYEETGIHINIVKQIGIYERFRTLSNGVRLHYKVFVFLAYGNGKPFIHDTQEILQCLWIPYQKALELLKDDDLKKICKTI